MLQIFGTTTHLNRGLYDVQSTFSMILVQTAGLEKRKNLFPSSLLFRVENNEIFKVRMFVFYFGTLNKSSGCSLSVAGQVLIILEK